MITYLDRNEFNYRAAAVLEKTLKEFDPNLLCSYTRIHEEGKKSIFSDFIAKQYQVDERQVILGYGGESILKDAIHYFLTESSNKKILLPKYSWWYYKSIAKEVDGVSAQYPLIEKGNSFEYDFDEFEKIVKEEQPKVILIASPNNPTGNALSVNDLKRLLERIDRETVVIIDEAYSSFANEDDSYIKELISEYSNILIVRTLSKFYGAPGLRLGFAFAGQMICKKFLPFTTKYLGYNRLSEELGIAILKATDYYRGIANEMQLEREKYYSQIRPLEGFKVYDSYANFILVKYPIELKNKLNNEFLEKDYIVKFMNEEDINTHMRITLGMPKHNQDIRDIIIRVANQRSESNESHNTSCGNSVEATPINR